MILPSSIEGPGYFWLPADPNIKLPGVLSISRHGASQLHLSRLTQPLPAQVDRLVLGAPFSYSGRAYHKRIVGIVKTDRFSDFVTLDNCYYSSWNMPGGLGISTSEIVANTVLFGVSFKDDEEILLSEFRFSFPQLDQWLRVSGIDITDETSDSGDFLGVTINYTPPENRTYELIEGMELEFNFDSEIPFGISFAETKVTQKPHISIKSEKLLPFSNFQSVAWKIRNFLSFCMDAPIAFDSAVGYSNERTENLDPSNTRRIPIIIYFESAPRVHDEVRINSLDMLLSYPDIENRFTETINCWLTEYDECQPIFDSYFYSKNNPNSASVETTFLLLSQAVESLHRRKSSLRVMSEDKYSQLVKCMLDAIPHKRRSFFKHKLRFGNEPTLTKRLEEMFFPFFDLYELNVSREEYIRKLVDTRNFLTHYDRKLATRAASGWELVLLQESLEALIQLHFLQILGVAKPDIASIVEGNNRISQKLAVSEDD